MKDSNLAFRFIWMALSEKNPVCNTVNQSFQRKIVFLTVCLDFPQNLTAKNIQNLGLQILSIGFSFFLPEWWAFMVFTGKKIWFQVSTVLCFCQPRVSFYRSAIWRIISKKILVIKTNPFWHKARKSTAGNYSNYCAMLLAWN